MIARAKKRQKEFGPALKRKLAQRKSELVTAAARQRGRKREKVRDAREKGAFGVKGEKEKKRGRNAYRETNQERFRPDNLSRQGQDSTQLKGPPKTEKRPGDYNSLPPEFSGADARWASHESRKKARRQNKNHPIQARGRRPERGNRERPYLTKNKLSPKTTTRMEGVRWIKQKSSWARQMSPGGGGYFADSISPYTAISLGGTGRHGQRLSGEQYQQRKMMRFNVGGGDVTLPKGIMFRGTRKHKSRRR